MDSNANHRQLFFQGRFTFPKDADPQCIGKFNPDKKISYSKRMKSPFEKNDEFIIYASDTMLELLASAKKLFIDGTFKVVPKGFSKLLNIIVNYKSIYVPVCHIVMRSKFQSSYSHAFSTLKQICRNRINMEMSCNSRMCDFEKTLQNTIKILSSDQENFIVEGCFFHFCKSL